MLFLMTEKPERRWQIHLSTALGLMILMGVLIPLNWWMPTWIDNYFNGSGDMPAIAAFPMLAIMPRVSLWLIYKVATFDSKPKSQK